MQLKKCMKTEVPSLNDSKATDVPFFLYRLLRLLNTLINSSKLLHLKTISPPFKNSIKSMTFNFTALPFYHSTAWICFLHSLSYRNKKKQKKKKLCETKNTIEM